MVSTLPFSSLSHTECRISEERLTRSFRGAVVSYLVEMAGIKLRDDSAQELKPSRIEKDNSDLSQITSEFEKYSQSFQY